MLNKIVFCLFIIATSDEVLAQNTEAASETHSTNVVFAATESLTVLTENITKATITTTNVTKTALRENTATEPHLLTKLYTIIVNAIQRFFSHERVKEVLHNVGTCMVNGAMEIITYFCPAPTIPLIASVAGLLLPFDPVITLKEKIPVASYRRAFNKAVNSFMGTFDRYKGVEQDDPYMTRRFNRRFLNNSPEED